jgi:dihydropteroate synthase
MKLLWSHYCLDFSARTQVMGILNVTPDSFSDGGFFFDRAKAIDQALQMVDEGADIIDIGGESTRPGAEAVTLEEELRRTIPVIEALAGAVRVPLSIDTYKSGVAGRALDAGASMVNDISGLRFDPAMAGVVARHGVPVIVMHIQGTPGDMQRNPVYEALIPEIADYLRGCIAIGVNAGVAEDRIVIDPGIGFGKTFDHNLQILKNLADFRVLGRPVAVGVSRKAFLGKILGGAPALERLEGTAAAVAASVLNGANIVRVHDVKEMSKVVKVVDAIMRGSVSPQKKTG